MATSNILGSRRVPPKKQAEQIKDYQEQFDFYCLAHGMEEGKQKALFLTSIGQQMYAKLRKHEYGLTCVLVNAGTDCGSLSRAHNGRDCEDRGTLQIL